MEIIKEKVLFEMGLEPKKNIAIEHTIELTKKHMIKLIDKTKKESVFLKILKCRKRNPNDCSCMCCVRKTAYNEFTKELIARVNTFKGTEIEGENMETIKKLKSELQYDGFSNNDVEEGKIEILEKVVKLINKRIKLLKEIIANSRAINKQKALMEIFKASISELEEIIKRIEG